MYKQLLGFYDIILLLILVFDSFSKKGDFMGDFSVGNVYSGFELLKNEYVDDIGSECYVFGHVKSGARLFYAKNSDKNKVFFIAFKTPPENDKGTAHIMEHSVLCGSQKYPVKDPFNELAKGSLNTYLNALTYSDKTMYPVASCNDKDFENLVSVYLDAVFKPNVVKDKRLFMQEGWHYELENPDGELKYNGVVYNEMKGALSQPDRILDNLASKSLFGDTPYGFESGGDPSAIPYLTYNEFKEFYNKFYNPANSYIYIYGDMEPEKYMNMVNEYISEFNCGNSFDIDAVNKTFKEYSEGFYPALKAEENGSYMSLNYVIGKSTDILLQFSMEILSYILFELNGSPVKKELINKGICGDVEGWFDNSTYQMTLKIVGKKCRFDDREVFKKTVYDVLENICKNGIDEKLLLSAINYMEFLLREADYGYRPKGLAHGMRMMYGYLHNSDPVESVKIWKYFDEIRNNISNGYFESLIKEKILNNSHKSFTVITPKEGLQAENDNVIKKELEDYKNSLSKEDLEKIVNDTKALKEFQESADSAEDLSKIPFVSINEVDKKSTPINWKKTGRGIAIEEKTDGIVYVKMMFSLKSVPKDMISYAALLSRVIGKLDTKEYSYEEMPSEINMYTGGIYGNCDIFEDRDGIKPVITINGKALLRNAEKLFGIFESLILNMDYSKTDSLSKIMRELALRNSTYLSDNGHIYSSLRALSYIKEGSKYKDLTRGITFNDFISDNIDNAEFVGRKLREVSEMIFTKDNFISASLSDDTGLKTVQRLFDKFFEKLPNGQEKPWSFEFEPSIYKEALTDSSKIVYNSAAADFIKLGFEYNGAFNAVKNIINTEYLWNQVRVKGGAYGCGCSVLRNGSLYFYSYRDPNILGTFNIYKSAGKFLRELKLSQSDIDKYILGAINDIDRPKSNSDKIDIAVLRYMEGISAYDTQKSRDELLSAGESDIAFFADILDAVSEKSAFVTIGNENMINGVSDFYNSVRKLIK